MQNTARVLLLTGFLLLPAVLFAQFNNNTTSPFSRFGLGDLHSLTFGRTAAMGGATLGSRTSQQINFANPASYTSVDTLSFLFEFGLNGKFSSYKNDLGHFTTNDVNFRYMAMSFPISDRIAIGLGLTPYSDVGYDISVNDSIALTGNINYKYYGDGSLSRAFIGVAVEPLKNISVGANLFYFFGTLSRNGMAIFPDLNDAYSIQRNDQIRIRDVGANFGIQTTLLMKKDQWVTLAATLESKPRFTAFYSDITIKSVSYYDPTVQKTFTDSDTVTYHEQVKGKVRLPLSAGAGISYVKKNKLEMNADCFYQAWSKASFPSDVSYELLKDRMVVAVGGEYIPDKFSIRSYTQRMAYRAGLKYEDSYLVINNQHIKDFGMSFGVGLPVYRSNSTINISGEVGKRGSTQNNLIRENYLKLNLSVNLYDLWFIKRKFD